MTSSSPCARRDSLLADPPRLHGVKLAELLISIDARQARIHALRPLTDGEAAQLRDYYKIGLTYSSNALEGNSLTESETRVVLEDGLTVGGKPLRDYLEAAGHAEAMNGMYALAATPETPLTENDVLGLHRLFFRLLDETQAGAYRRQRVFVSGSRHRFPEPDDVPGLMAGLLDAIPAWEQTLHPVVCAAVVHRRFIAVHPFVDGNGRVARLLMNLILLRHGHVMTIIPPVLRTEYIAALEASHPETQHTETPFFTFVARCHGEAQKEYLRLLS